MKLPFKVAIMQHFILNPDTSFDVNEILEAMKPVYVRSVSVIRCGSIII